MTRALHIAALALLASCAWPLSPGSTRLAGREGDIVDAVIAEGAARGISSLRCAEERSQRFVIVDATDAVMRDRVGYCAAYSPICLSTAQLEPQARWNARAADGCLLGGCAGGSTAWVQDDVWPASLGRWRAEVFLSAYLTPDHRLRTLVHEAVHWLAGCARGGPDGTHSDPALWGADGLERTVQAWLRGPS